MTKLQQQLSDKEICYYKKKYGVSERHQVQNDDCRGFSLYQLKPAVILKQRETVKSSRSYSEVRRIQNPSERNPRRQKSNKHETVRVWIASREAL